MTLEKGYFIAQIIGGTASLITAMLAVWMFFEQRRNRNQALARPAIPQPPSQEPSELNRGTATPKATSARSFFYGAIFRWLSFTALTVLLPIALIVFQRLVMKQPITIQSVFSHGELLLLGSTLCGASVARLLIQSRLNRFSVVVAGACLMILITCSLLYATVVNAQFQGISISTNAISLQSMFLFLFALVASTSANVLAET